MKARTAGIIAEGLVTGVVGHIAIALVLVFSDLVAGRWVFYTPAVLGTSLLSDGGQGCLVAPEATVLLAYTSVHLITLTLFGLLAAWLIHGSEQRPILWFGALMTFVVVAWHLTAAVLGVLGPVQSCLSLWPITVAGFAGALAMAVYLWRSHPRLSQALRGERYA
jgi:hypothetical protein